MEKNKQGQSSGDNSTNIQAAGNVTFVGVSYDDARKIAIDVFKANFLELQGEAQKVALQRAEELVVAFLTKIQEENIPIDAAKDPDMQHVLFSAQRDYARSGKDNLKMLLVDILVERAKTGDNELKKIVLNEAILVAPKLTIKQLNAISIRFLIAESRNPDVNNVEKFKTYLKSNLLPFCNELAKERSDYKHIEYAGCGTVGLLNSDIYTYLKGNYSGVLSLGFDDGAIPPLALNPQQRSKLIIPCLNDQSKLQISAINDEAISFAGQERGLNENQITQLKDLQNKHLFSKEAVEQQLTSMDKRFIELLHTWSNSGLGRLELTTVGIALAHANIKKTIDLDLDLEVWIK